MSTELKPFTSAGRIPTPVFPAEPPKEVKEMSFNASDLSLLGDSASDSVISVDKKPVETVKPEVETKVTTQPEINTPAQKEEVKAPEVKKEEPKKEMSATPAGLKPPKEEAIVGKVEPKKEETVVKEQKEESTIKPISPVKETTTHDGFDYSGFSQQEVLNLKNMSRQSREWAATLLKENRHLSTLKDSTYLQHEQGYTLSPDYRELQGQGYRASVEARCWEQALLNIKNSKPFRDIVGFNDKGQPQFGPELQPSDQDEIRVSNNLSSCVNAVNQISGQLQVFPGQFKQRVQNDLMTIQNERNSRFAWRQDPKLMEYTVGIDGRGEKKVKDIISDFKSIFPSYLANTPGVDVAADLWVALTIQSNQLREAMNGKQVAEIKQEEIKRGEPSSDILPTDVVNKNKKGTPSEFSLKGSPLDVN